MPNTSYSYYLHCNSLHSRIAAYAHDNILPLLHCLRGDAFVSSSACHNSVRQWPKISIFASAGKTMRWIEKWLTPFRIVTTFSISVQSLGEIELRAPAVGAKLNWCFCMSRFVCLRVGDIVQTSIVWRFMGRFWCALRCFFSEWIVISDALHSSHFCCWLAPQFSRNCCQKLRKVQKSAEKFVRTTSYR